MPLSRSVLRPQKPRIEILIQSHPYRISAIYVMDTFTSFDDLTTCLTSSQSEGPTVFSPVSVLIPVNGSTEIQGCNNCVIA